MKTLIRTSIGAGLAAAFALLLAVGVTSTDTAEAGVTGGLHTTDINCNGVDLNLYGNKLDVYIEGGPNKVGASALTPGNYGVQVTAPNGFLLGASAGATQVVGGDGVLPCAQLWDIVFKPGGGDGYDDTTNNGGEYKVRICLNDDFEGSDCKSDNFKVPDEDVPPPPLDACTGHENRTVVRFDEKIGNPGHPLLDEESAAVLINIAAGTYVVTLQSTDDAHPLGETQNFEQWFAVFGNGGGEFETSGTISDLPTADITINEVLPGQLVLGADVTFIIARHDLAGAWPNAVDPESIEAVCMALDRVDVN